MVISTGCKTESLIVLFHNIHENFNILESLITVYEQVWSSDIGHKFSAQTIHKIQRTEIIEQKLTNFNLNYSQ